ncbi:hypothetical protein [Alkalinema sp. FACHB-956]|uniref:hypothetical protein n=1 Tax=Alkalinema sp. FACHB-956 TaxID=2692768 RepID=UPI001686A1DE|nr:hypothetical protein [Alkalinema sp. FACHB-956]MBD2326939.1 hypothetical protein [Alkalinema sp. FACHB-956]
MLYRFAILAVVWTTAVPGFAQNVLSTQAVTARVIQAAANYQAAISCNDIPPEAKNIAALVPYRIHEDRMNAMYAVFWSGDIGCNGGSGTTFMNLSIVTVGVADTFIVDPLRSSPAVSIDFPSRGYERIVGNTKDSIIIDAADYGPNDSNCCPSLRFRYTLKLDEKGNWNQVAKKQLPPKR